ncbi:MAG: hypothetical protein NT128_07805 [Proteobacteria bacterium]|nr:hypothetical protein [Pseudomonadota bacterium]
MQKVFMYKILKKVLIVLVSVVFGNFFPAQSTHGKVNPHYLSRQDILEKSCDKESVESLKNEVLEKFTLMDRPITPAAFKSMEQWISDLIPGVITIDLLATINSNQFFGEVTFEKNEELTWYALKNEKENSSFEYAFIGKIDNDKCVVVTRSNGGGSLTTCTLVILKIERDTTWDWDKSAYEKQVFDNPVPRYRVLAKQIAYLHLPFVGDFELKENALTIKRDDLGKSMTINLSKIMQGQN